MGTVMEIRNNAVVFTREYDAPRDLVYDTYTDPDLMPNWWGPSNLKTVVEKMTVSPGGVWRIVQSDEKGKEYAFHGVYHGVTRPCRIVSTFEYEGTPDKVILETITFDELPNGKTRLTGTSVFQSPEDRDEVLKAGMEKGRSESHDRLGTLLKNFINSR